jgi:hypothetical protein
MRNADDTRAASRYPFCRPAPAGVPAVYRLSEKSPEHPVMSFHKKLSRNIRQEAPAKPLQKPSPSKHGQTPPQKASLYAT